ncbi:hypothetical protein [Patulibacter sp. SYSU D01012]|uniref:hypothetical protein n=1 Tax=Patulibacter sp. SYSU D01012 TaxID=2817381 RepID=UPI001B30B2AF|nr:hypothetical protein [Patulibacter sp. SYSU D01012]
MTPPLVRRFWVRGRLRTRFVLTDEADRELGRLERDRWHDDRARTRDEDGALWQLETTGGRARAVCGDREVQLGLDALWVGDARYALRLATDGSRTAKATDESGAPVLVARPAPERGGPFLLLALSPALAEPYAAAMAVAFALVRIDGGFVYPIGGPGGGT